MNNSHYHLDPATELLVDFPGTVEACHVCSPHLIPKAPTPISNVTAHLAQIAPDVPQVPNIAHMATHVPTSRKHQR